MAKASKELEGGASLEAELICSICLCLYKDPVSLSCNHSFCQQCIQKVLTAQQQSQAPLTCPMCRLHLGPNGELQENFHLCNIVKAFQAKTSKDKHGKGSEEGETEAFLCECCLYKTQPAVKTCLICDPVIAAVVLRQHQVKALFTHRTASQNSDIDMVDVVVVQMDHARIRRYQSLMWDCPDPPTGKQ